MQFSSKNVSLGQSGEVDQCPFSSRGGRSGRWRVGSEPQRVSPDAVRQAARDRVAKLQQALEVLGDISEAEVDGLRSALEKAKKLSSEECKGFIARAEKRVADWTLSELRRLLLWKKDEPGCNVSSQKYRARLTLCCHQKILCPRL